MYANNDLPYHHSMGTGDFYPTHPSIYQGPGTVPIQYQGINSASFSLNPTPNSFVFNIVILADGKALGSQSDELAAKIGKAIAAAMAMKDAQGMVDELAE